MSLPISQDQFDLLKFDDIFSFSPPNDAHLPSIPETANEDTFSFFFPFYQQLLSPMGKLPHTTINDKRNVPAPFRKYPSPNWTDWKSHWRVPPIGLEINAISIPEHKTIFQSTLFRLLTLQPSYITHPIEETRFIQQGTTLTFKGHENEDVRFIVEWLQFIYGHTAFVKITAVTSTGSFFPYTDPDFPSFILIAPLCLVYVPPPPSLELYYTLPLDTEDEEEHADEDVEVCWGCKLSFPLKTPDAMYTCKF